MRPRPAMATAIALASFALIVLAPSPAQAAFIADSSLAITGTTSTSGPGFFTGTLAVDNIVGSTTQAVIQITLMNTSPIANGGFITGFAFNNPGSNGTGNITGVSSFTQSYNPAGAPPANNMLLIGGSSFNNTISGSPYGAFDIGAATGGDLLGGGTPQPGIEIGQTATFTFTVTGDHLNNLTAQSIINALSYGSTQTAPLLVRFRGFNNGASDKVVAGGVGSPPPPPPPPPPPAPVPAPAGLLLGIIGVGCLLGRSVRRKTAAAIVS